LALGKSAAEVPGKDCFARVESIVQILKEYNKGDGRQHTVSRSEENVNEIKQFSGAVIQLTETVTRLRDSIRTVTNPEAEINLKDVSDLHMLVSTAEAWTLLGFLQVTLYVKLGLMDPIAKKILKLHYVSEDVSIVTQLLSIFFKIISALTVIFLCGEGNEAHQLGTVLFVCKRIISTVRRVVCVSGRMSCIIFRGC
jgi:hypothetical protein